MEEETTLLPWCDHISLHHSTSCSNTRGKSSETVSKSSDTGSTSTPSFDNSIETISTVGITEESFASLALHDDWSPSCPADTPPPATQSSGCGRSNVVSFGTVRVRTYERILLAHPACSHGPGIGLGWAYYDDDDTADAITVDSYEQVSNELRQQRLSSARCTAIMLDSHDWYVDHIQDMESSDNLTTQQQTNTPAQVLPRQERIALLVEWGVTRRDIHQATVESLRIRRERNATVRQVRRELRLARRQEQREKLKQQRNNRRWWFPRSSKKENNVVAIVVDPVTEEESSSSGDEEQSAQEDSTKPALISL